jgi:hypothetical protein
VETVFVLFLVGVIFSFVYPNIEESMDDTRYMDCQSRLDMVKRAKSAYVVDHLGQRNIVSDDDWAVFKSYFTEPIPFHCTRVAPSNPAGTYSASSLRNLYEVTVCPYCTTNPR